MTETFGKKDKNPNEGKRPAPIIEGSATEVSVEPQEAAAETASSQDENVETDKTDSLSPPPPRRSGFGSFVSHALAGLLGGVIGVIALALAWSGLDLGGGKSVTPQLETIDGRVAKLEAATQALATKAPEIPSELAALSDRVTEAEAMLQTLADTTQDGSMAPDSAAIDKQIAETEQRLSAKIDEALAKAEDASNATVQALQDQIADVRTRLSALAEAGTAADMEKLQPEIDALGSRIAKLESAIPGVAEIVSKETAEAKIAAVAIAFANLRSAVSEGSPFVAELDVLKLLSPNTDLGALASHAKTGIPIVNALAQGFTAAKDVALTETPAASDGSLLGDLRASAQSLVTIRRLDEAATGDEPAAVLARAQADLDQGKLADSVKQVEALEGTPRAAFTTWLDQAHARLAAENELKQLESRLLVSLSGATREIGRD